MRQAQRAIFAVVVAVGDAAVKAATGLGAASVPSRPEPNRALRGELKHLAKYGTNRVKTHAEMRRGK